MQLKHVKRRKFELKFTWNHETKGLGHDRNLNIGTSSEAKGSRKI